MNKTCKNCAFWVREQPQHKSGKCYRVISTPTYSNGHVTFTETRQQDATCNQFTKTGRDTDGKEI